MPQHTPQERAKRKRRLSPRQTAQKDALKDLAARKVQAQAVKTPQTRNAVRAAQKRLNKFAKPRGRG